MKTTTLIAALLVVGALCPAHADETVANHPGFFPIEDLQLFSDEDLTIDVNLRGPILRMVAAAERDDDDFARLVSSLQRIRVIVADVAASREAEMRSACQQLAERLAGSGWERIVKVRDRDDHLSVFVREQDAKMQGLTLCVLDGGEAIIANIVGTIDLAELGRLPVLNDLEVDFDDLDDDDR
jgi:hypothetical protein